MELNGSEKFKQNWKIISQYLKDGVSLIPVRDKATTTRLAKTPYQGWKVYTQNIITEQELFEQMDKHDTTACAMIMGRVSGNMEAIDIDEKNEVGVSVKFFAQIEQFMPETWQKLRIHKSPSGGHHIIYRISDHPPEGNKKLAYPEGKTEASIETRGEGGFILSEVCLNYSVVKNNPIPQITWQERCSLFSIAKSFNKRVQVEYVKAAKEHTSIYDENPFDHYNKADQGKVLQEVGWEIIGENAEYIHYVRPGKKQGISASFIKEKCCYYIFTSSTEFDPSRGYFPSMILSKCKFNGDNRALYQYLVDKGFGKVNPSKEIKFAENKAKHKEPLPNNFSEQAKEKYEETKTKMEADYPYGEFIKWNPDDEKNEVSREAFYMVSEKLGFRLYNEGLVQIVDKTVYKRDNRFYFDTLKGYIKEEDPDLLEENLNIYEKFIQKNGEFSISRLAKFDESIILKDDRQNAFLFYENCYLHITSDKIEVKNYEDFPEGVVIFSDKIQCRDFVLLEKNAEIEDTEVGESGEIIPLNKERDNPYGIYGDYIERTVGVDSYIKQILGFLLHDFKDETTGYIPVLSEKVENPEEGGGSGKNVFCSLLSLIQTTVNKNCNSAKTDEKFFQIWNGQRIMILSDLTENFNFGFLKEASTGSLLHKRLFKNEAEVPVDKTPKFVCQTNYSAQISDGGIKRRIRLVEFSDFFTRCGGIDQFYKKHFPNDWSKEDFIGFDNFVVDSLQEWLKAGLKINEPEISLGGWLKRFKKEYGATITDIIDCYIDSWLKIGRIRKDVFLKDLTDYYQENNTNRNYQPSVYKINKALTEYCHHHQIPFKKDCQWSENGISVRGKSFLTEAAEQINDENDVSDIKTKVDPPF